MNRHELLIQAQMVQVWEEGRRSFPSETASWPRSGPDSHLSWMLHHASWLIDQNAVGPKIARGWLWNIANAASRLLPEDYDVPARALEEYARAAKKHPGMTLECDGHTDASRLFALVEEIGEVAACLTYDNDAETGHGSDLESEVIQVIALALAWATRYLDD